MSESSSNSPKGRPRLRRVFVWALLGIFAVQVAWVFTVPPFRGLDEHDHSYKVAAVARGDWSPRHEVSPDGWGEFVVVPAALVEAASPVCEALPYTTSDNCSAGPSHGGGLVEVADSAARYNPAFYALVGIPARWADGADSLYAMRLTAVFLCALLIAGAVTVLRSWAETDAPLVGLLLALTPTMVYTTSVGADIRTASRSPLRHLCGAPSSAWSNVGTTPQRWPPIWPWRRSARSPSSRCGPSDRSGWS